MHVPIVARASIRIRVLAAMSGCSSFHVLCDVSPRYPCLQLLYTRATNELLPPAAPVKRAAGQVGPPTAGKAYGVRLCPRASVLLLYHLTGKAS